MEDKPISVHQLSYLTFLLLIGSALVYVPSEAAGQSAWISTILALIPGIFILYTVIRRQSIFPNYRISQISTMVLGKVPGT
ncbi:MAG: GerAB/ArcD/ProY family transporter, partial [Syntrophomonadaceae bacterium]|nr:GerAB/ArcD/ProY family transporter [Syntrophomonadaceae bacterium]